MADRQKMYTLFIDLCTVFAGKYPFTHNSTYVVVITDHIMSVCPVGTDVLIRSVKLD